MRERIIAGTIGFVLLAGCTSWETDYPDTLTEDVTADWHIDEVTVFVPEELTTTEANRLFPEADIVWHGDPVGDRKAQVARIMDDGITAGTVGLDGPRHVDLDVRLVEFHAVSPAAVSRAPSAVHNISFVIHARDNQTGEIIAGPDLIDAQLEAYVGAFAAAAAIEGRTQKVRITNHLAATTAGWLAAGPDNRGTFETIGR